MKIKLFLLRNWERFWVENSCFSFMPLASAPSHVLRKCWYETLVSVEISSFVLDGNQTCKQKYPEREKSRKLWEQISAFKTENNLKIDSDPDISNILILSSSLTCTCFQFHILQKTQMASSRERWINKCRQSLLALDDAKHEAKRKHRRCRRRSTEII